MKRFSKRTWVVIAIVLAVAMSAIGAFAYWTTTGSGTAPHRSPRRTARSSCTARRPRTSTPGGSSSVTFTADNAGASNLFVGDDLISSGVSADGGHASL